MASVVFVRPGHPCARLALQCRLSRTVASALQVCTYASTAIHGRQLETATTDGMSSGTDYQISAHETRSTNHPLAACPRLSIRLTWSARGDPLPFSQRLGRGGAGLAGYQTANGPGRRVPTAWRARLAVRPNARHQAKRTTRNSLPVPCAKPSPSWRRLTGPLLPSSGSGDADADAHAGAGAHQTGEACDVRPAAAPARLHQRLDPPSVSSRPVCPLATAATNALVAVLVRQARFIWAGALQAAKSLVDVFPRFERASLTIIQASSSRIVLRP